MKAWILVFVGIFVAGCGGGAVLLTHQEAGPPYDTAQFAYAAAGRDLRVVIVGSPFDGDQSSFERAVTDAMQGHHWGQRTHFTVDPGENARDIYRVVMLFNPPANLPGERLCRDDPAALSPKAYAGGRLGVYAAFCRSDKLLTRVRGTIEAAGGPNDPPFLDMIAQVTRELFPLRRRDDDDNRCPRVLLC